jgi:uncharacterized membrane protein YfcA
MSAPELALLALAAVTGFAAQSATGFGVALPVAPVAFALLPPADAVVTVVLASLMHNLLVLASRRRRLQIRSGDCLLLVAVAPPGLIAGALLVADAPKAPMQLAVGVAILTAVAFRLHEPGRAAALAGRAAGIPIGLLAGALTTTVGINGPPLVLWLRARGATLGQLRDSLAVVFLALNLAAVPSLTAQGGTIPAGAAVTLAGALLAGHAIGLRLPERAADRALAAVLALAGAASAIAGAAALL